MTVDPELLDFLGGFVTDHKKEKMAAVLGRRTRHLTVALEDIYQPHNASACLRSCECLGVQDLHVVEGRNEYSPSNEVAMGSAKWLTFHHYRRTADCLDALRERGYRLVATTPNVEGHDLATLPLDRPVALLFGTEEEGLSDEALAAADATLRLPQYGFTQSFNVSVSVALCLSRLVERLRAEDVPWQLSEDERREITLAWYRAVVTRHDVLEREFWERQ